MSRNGAGIYQLPVYGNPVVNGTVIDPVWANGNFSDMATALTTSVSSDGQTPITGNLMMSGFKHTGAGSATGAGQYTVYGQLAALFGNLQLNGSGASSYDVVTAVNDGGKTLVVGVGGSAAAGWSQNAAHIGTTTSDPLLFGSNAIEQMRLESAAAATLDIGTKTAFFPTAGRANISLNGSTGAILNFGVAGTGLGYAFHDGTNLTLNNLFATGALNLSTNNTTRLSIGADGRVAGTALHNNSTLPTGTANQYIASGTYTPTLTTGSNVSAASSNGACQWIRVGNVVTVSGSVNFTASAASAFQFGVSLPIPSTLGVTASVAGAGQFNGNLAYGISGDSTNNRATFFATAPIAQAYTGPFTFTYVVL